MLKGAKAYFQTQVTTTSQGDLLVMLYDGAIKFLNQAKERIAEKDYAQKGILISKAMDVINELDESLNNEKGGEVAENLHQLYFFCNTRLLRANMDMNPDIIDEVLKVLEGLRDAFNSIKNSVPTQQAPTQGGSPNANRPAPAASTPATPQKPKASAARAAAAYGATVTPIKPQE